MAGSHDIFTIMAKENRDLHVELGDNTKYAVEGIGNIQFQLESSSLIEVKEVMYVSCMHHNVQYLKIFFC